MKFSEAWANVAKQNINLKVVVLCLTVCTLFLCFSVLKLSIAEPFVLERSCYTNSLTFTKPMASKAEMKVFIEIALKQRFETETPSIEGYLSVDELRSKEKEQKILAEKELLQFLIVRKIRIEEKIISVQADRLYSVKSIRSGFPTIYKLKLESKPRTQTNPYGLILIKTDEIKNTKKENS